MLIVFCGLPATGKTTLAAKLAKKTGATILRTDVIRKEIIMAEPKYTEEEKELVYAEMFSRAQKLLSAGKNVILDANFYKKSQRCNAKSIAERAKTKFFLVECVLPEEEVRKRMNLRKAAKDESDANIMEIYYKIKAAWEPIAEPHIVVDTSKRGAWGLVEEAIIGKKQGL